MAAVDVPADMNAAAGATAHGGSGAPTEADLSEARRLADYWEPPRDPFTAIFYALHVRHRRREIAKREQRARVDRDKAIDAADAAFTELGRGLHMRAHELDLAPVSYFVGEADRLALVMEQQTDRRARAQAKAELEAAWMKLGEHAWQRGAATEEPERLAQAVGAVRAGDQYTREAELCALGVDLYDAKAFRTGTIVVATAVLFSLAALAFALLR